jgi:hypothetical protein
MFSIGEPEVISINVHFLPPQPGILGWLPLSQSHPIFFAICDNVVAMPQKKEKSSERTNRAGENKQWVREGKRHVTFADEAANVGPGPYPPPPDDENNATQTDPSFEAKWNALVEQHRAARHALHEIENKMWEMQYSRQQMSTERPSAHRPQSSHPNSPNADSRGILSEALGLYNDMAKLEIAHQEQVDLGDIDLEEQQRRKELQQAQNIWARFDRHSQPRHR